MKKVYVVEGEVGKEPKMGLMIILKNERLILYKNLYGDLIKVPVSVISNRLFIFLISKIDGRFLAANSKLWTISGIRISKNSIIISFLKKIGKSSK